ncbi:hypothetical protein VP01_781g1 [Puccinia sorghi]|uniref:Uncharacterized protein n=1 Tax=Puccinia sorghi TaxID=27349 RepID=A0A0L6UB36_9BASI|nr:hypothetical protein VP01_781g1 [Puccinia sorghi]
MLFLRKVFMAQQFQFPFLHFLRSLRQWWLLLGGLVGFGGSLGQLEGSQTWGSSFWWFWAHSGGFGMFWKGWVGWIGELGGLGGFLECWGGFFGEGWVVKRLWRGFLGGPAGAFGWFRGVVDFCFAGSQCKSPHKLNFSLHNSRGGSWNCSSESGWKWRNDSQNGGLGLGPPIFGSRFSQPLQNSNIKFCNINVFTLSGYVTPVHPISPLCFNVQPFPVTLALDTWHPCPCVVQSYLCVPRSNLCQLATTQRQAAICNQSFNIIAPMNSTCKLTQTYKCYKPYTGPHMFLCTPNLPHYIFNITTTLRPNWSIGLNKTTTACDEPQSHCSIQTTDSIYSIEYKYVPTHFTSSMISSQRPQNSLKRQPVSLLELFSAHCSLKLPQYLPPVIPTSVQSIQAYPSVFITFSELLYIIIPPFLSPINSWELKKPFPGIKVVHNLPDLLTVTHHILRLHAGVIYIPPSSKHNISESQTDYGSNSHEPASPQSFWLLPPLRHCSLCKRHKPVHSWRNIKNKDGKNSLDLIVEWLTINDLIILSYSLNHELAMSLVIITITTPKGEAMIVCCLDRKIALT